MGRKLFLLNLVMVAAIALLAQQLVASWSAFRSEPRIFAPPEGSLPAGPPSAEEPSSSLSEFMVITEHNLFSENRGNEPLEAVTEEEEKPPEFTATPELLSVLTVRGEKQAVLTIFSGRRGRESENRTVRLGDDVEGYEVSEIGRDHLVLRWREVEEIIELTRDRTASSNRQGTARHAIKIITVGAAAAAVETTQAASEETERGLLVGSVGGQQQTGGRRGGTATGGQNSLGGAGNRGNLGGRAGRGNQQDPLGTVGLGTQRQPVQPTQPPR